MNDSITPATAPETPLAAPHSAEPAPREPDATGGDTATGPDPAAGHRTVTSRFTATVRTPADLMVSVCVANGVKIFAAEAPEAAITLLTIVVWG